MAFSMSKLVSLGVLMMGSFAISSSAFGADKVRICLPLWKADQLKTAVILAQTQKFFAQNKIDVEFVHHQPVALSEDFNRGETAKKIDDFAQADVARLGLIANDDQAKRPCEFAVTLSDAFFQSGVPADKFSPLLFSRYGHGYDTHLIVPKNSKIQSVKDLKGKKLALGPVMSRLALDLMLEKAGLSRNDLTIVSTNPFARVRQLRDSEIDAAIIYNPAMAILLSEGSVRIVEENVIEKYLKIPVPHTILIANAAYAKRNAKIVSRLIDAVEKGNRVLSGEPTLLASVTEEYAKTRGEKIHSYGASNVVLAKSAQIMGDFKLYNMNSQMDNGASTIRVVDALGKFQDALLEHKYIQKKTDLSKWM